MLKRGDVIFIADKSEKNISELSLGYGGSSYCHCSLYIGNNKTIEAVKNDGVIIGDLDQYSSNAILAARTNQDKNFLNDVIKFAQDLVGCEYNDLFLPDQKNKFYCSELLHKVFSLVNKTSFFKLHTLNYISPNDIKVCEYWSNFYANFNLQVPQGKVGSHPNNLSLDKKFKYRFWI